MMVVVLLASVASAQSKKPSFADMMNKAVAEKVVTSDQKDLLMEINTQFNKDKSQIAKSDKSQQEKKAELQRAEGKKNAEFKKIVGDQGWAGFVKFREEFRKNN
ncbi:hypothetical protein FACS1894159_05640 [Bacteroidia bacterium]|nr:hypothetical protein FACS1894159_05640 [Bacteroidia bacterium]